jgi:hypothetical protein
MKKIGVLGACDTAGVVATLQTIVPETTHVEPAPHVGDVRRLVSENKLPDLLLALQTYDRIFVSSAHQSSIGTKLDLPITYYPTLVFNAFHPDIIYIRPAPGKDFVAPHYNSAIVVWCYINKVLSERVPSYFSARTFEALGYFDKWADAVTQQRQMFELTEVAFDPYMLHMSRHLPFMHSLNHPKILAIATMTRLLARTLGSRPDLDDPIYIPDGLAGDCWPIYPEIGHRFGLHGTYDWTRDQQHLDLPRYVRRAYAHYDKLGLDPATITLAGNKERLDTALGAIT